MLLVFLAWKITPIMGFCVLQRQTSEPLKSPNIVFSDNYSIRQLQSDVMFPYGQENTGVISCDGIFCLSHKHDPEYFAAFTTLDFRLNCISCMDFWLFSGQAFSEQLPVNLKGIWIRYNDKFNRNIFQEVKFPPNSTLDNLHLMGMNSSQLETILESVKSNNGRYLRVLDIRQVALPHNGSLPSVVYSFQRLRTLVLKELVTEFLILHLNLSKLFHLKDTLEYLDISDNRGIFLYNLKVLHYFKSLRVLDVSGTFIKHDQSYVGFPGELFFEQAKLSLFKLRDLSLTYFEQDNDRHNQTIAHIELLKQQLEQTQMDLFRYIGSANRTCNALDIDICQNCTNNYSLQELYTDAVTSFINVQFTGYPLLCIPQIRSLHKVYLVPRETGLDRRLDCKGRYKFTHLDNLREINLNNLVKVSQYDHLPVEHYIACITDHPENIIRFGTGGLDVNLEDYINLCNILERVQLLNLSSSNIIEIPAVTFKNCSQTTHLDLSFNHIQSLDPDLVRNMKQLQRIILSHNNLLVLNLNFPQNVDRIDASSILIQYITKGSRDSMQQIAMDKDITLDLSNNSLSCGCDLRHLDTIKWIRTTDVNIINKYSLFCSGIHGKEHLTEVDIFLAVQVCFPSYVNVIVSTCCGTIVVIMFVVSVTLCYKYRYRVKTNLLKLQQRIKSRNNNKHGDLTVKYDAFISYCAEDRFWVHKEVLEVLETKHGFNLCVHYRDFPAGGDLCEVIVNSMLQSEVIIVVLSQEFLQKPWCEYELQQAQAFVVNYHKHLVIIKKGDIPKQFRTGLVGTILHSRIYISWPEECNDISSKKYEDKRELFWQKMVNEMHHNKDSCLVSCCKRHKRNAALEHVELKSIENTGELFTCDQLI